MSQMKAPKSGVRVRMYRQGQGDCFLLAFPRKGGTVDDPVYLLIDCGMMNGSGFSGVTFTDVIDDIAKATKGHIDYVAITHEHADHVNGFNRKNKGKRLFDKVNFGHIWLAWTEEDEPFANSLRERFNDTLVALALAEDHINAIGVTDVKSDNLATLLALDLGEPKERAALAADFKKMGADRFGAVKGITNKEAIKYLRDRAQTGPSFLRPGQTPFEIGGTTGARVYTLGPPRDVDLLLSLDPVGDEEFHAADLALNGEAAAFHMAMTTQANNGTSSPFSKSYAIPENDVLDRKRQTTSDDDLSLDYACAVYRDDEEADWRRIDGDWLRTSNSLALRMNHEVNNTSLVLAFELPETGKVLLFTGDAQRGNWISWSDITWNLDRGPLTAKELLGRCVFYKCGHHGSHNATLDGEESDDYANLSWLGRGEFAKDFMAMIPVHANWANEEKNWNHPLPSIEHALMKKARGRILRPDVARVKRPDGSNNISGLTDAEWEEFKNLSIEARLYKEIIIEDVP